MPYRSSVGAVNNVRKSDLETVGQCYDIFIVHTNDIRTVTVLIGIVPADFRCTRINRSIRVITVALIFRESVPVVIHIFGTECIGAVTILINTVAANVFCSRINCSIAVVAIPGSFRERIAVVIHIFGVRRTYRITAVTVLVNTIAANIFCTRINCSIAVVTVTGSFRKCISVVVHIFRFRRTHRIAAVTVLIYAIAADIFCTRINSSIRVVAIPGGFREGIAVIIYIFGIRRTHGIAAVTILIYAVAADVFCARINSSICVVAVTGSFREGIAVVVHIFGVRRTDCIAAVTVLIYAVVADVLCARIDCSIAVVTISGSF